MQAQATLGHPTMFWDMEKGNSAASQNGNSTRSSSKGSDASPPQPKNLIAADHERLLRVFKASDEADEGGATGRQICLFSERLDVCLGKKPEPGSRAPEVQKMKQVNLMLIAKEGCCKQTKGGKCEQRVRDGLVMSKGQDPALRVFCCSNCDRIVEQVMEGMPNLQASSTESAWNGFAIQVGLELPPSGVLDTRAKTLFDFAHTLNSLVTAGSAPLAISKDMRLMARTRTAGRDLGLMAVDEGPRLEISLVEKNSVLHVIDLAGGTTVQSLSFSFDGTLLLATLQDRQAVSSLVVWSMITGKPVRRTEGTRGATLVASFSESGDRVFCVSLSREGGQRLVAMMQVMFWKTTPDLSENFRTDKLSLSECMLDRKASFQYKTLDHSGETSWTSGDGSVKVFSSGKYEALGEHGSVLYHFAARSTEQNDAFHRRDAVALDQKRCSTSKAVACLQKMLKTLDSRSNKSSTIKKGSISQDGSVFAHVFEPTDLHREGEFRFLLPSNKTVLVWNLKCGELCHRFEQERPVTCIQVSTDGAILLVGVSGFVGGHSHAAEDRLEQSAVLVYSLITREVLWEVPLMHDVLEAHLAEKELLFEIYADTATGSKKRTVYSVPTSDVSRFPCSGPGDDQRITELKPLHDIEENLAVVTADELVDNLGAAALTSHRSVSSNGSENPHPRPRAASLLSDHVSKPVSPLQSWRSATLEKRMVGLCVSGDGLRYVAKWDGLGEGGQATWLSVGNVDWGQGLMLHRENLMLLEAGVQYNVQAETIGAFCMSSDGNIVALSIHGTCRVVVLHVPEKNKGPAAILWEFDAEVVPKALGISGEKLSVMGDKDLQVSFALKDTIVLCYSLVTRVQLSKVQHKCSGKTLGTDGSGELRVSLNHEHRVILERWGTGEVLYEVFDSSLQFLGISGAGNRILMKEAEQSDEMEMDCRCGLAEMTIKKRKGSAVARERANHSLKQIDIPNFELFGPSKETCGTWMASGEMAGMFAVFKHRLSRWLLFDQVVYEADQAHNERRELTFFSKLCTTPTAETAHLHLTAFPGQWSKTVSKLVREKDYDSINLILEACPVMWAVLVYTKLEDVLDEEADVTTDLFQQGLANNDRLLVQLLLEGVKNIVTEDKGANCPVSQMEHVTEFITQCLKQSRMLDIVEKFLKELPMIKVDETDVRKHVRSHFRHGRVISTGWGSRDAEALTGPWGLKDTTEEAEQKSREYHNQAAQHEHAWVSSSHNFERGYQYVCPLPRLCDQEFLELITAYQASPGLLDNESMRATIRVLEGDLQKRLLGLPLSAHFFTFLVCLACFCGFVELCITPVAPDGFSKLSRDEIWAEDKGKAGVVLGGISTLLNFIFLLYELQKMANSRPIWTYIKPWNVIPWLSNLMAIINFAVFMTDADIVIVRSTAGFAMLLLWSTTFTFFRTIRQLSALVNMLLEIMYDMSMFILVVAVLVLSFAGALYCLHGKIIPEAQRLNPPDVISGPSSNVFLWASDSILRAFVMSVLQSFSESQLQSPLNSGTLTTLSYLFFFGLAMLVSVVGMNALIAIMNNSYTRVAESEHPVRDKEVASVMLDKLRNFGKATKTRWQKQRRWVHILSPSEKGSLLDNNSNTVVEQIRRELHALEARQGLQLGHLEKVITSHEEQTTENVTIVRELDTTLRSTVQTTDSKQSIFLKKVRDDQETMQKEMKALTATVRGMERKVTSDLARAAAGLQPDFGPLERLPQHFEDLEQNLEVIMPHVVSLQQDMARMVKQMQSFEWHMQFKLREGTGGPAHGPGGGFDKQVTP